MFVNVNKKAIQGQTFKVIEKRMRNIFVADSISMGLSPFRFPMWAPKDARFL